MRRPCRPPLDDPGRLAGWLRDALPGVVDHQTLAGMVPALERIGGTEGADACLALLDWHGGASVARLAILLELDPVDVRARVLRDRWTLRMAGLTPAGAPRRLASSVTA